MKKILRLTEKDISMLVKKILRESDPGDGKPDDFSDYVMLNKDEEEDEDPDLVQNLAERIYYRRLSEQSQQEITTKINGLKSCYSNAGKTFPGPCEKGTHSVCREKIRSTATSFFEGNTNAQNDSRIEKFWGCINKIDSSILQGMG
jgi:hypothetical protein